MLMMFWQVQRLTREINYMQRQIMEKHNELSNYQKYAGRLGGSENLNAANIAGLPSFLIPRAMLFAQYANQASSMSAMQNLQMMKMSGMVPWTGNALSQYQLEMSAFARFKQESLKALKQQEANVLNEKEKEIQLEITELQARLDMKKQMLQNCKQELKEEVQNSAPTFGL